MICKHCQQPIEAIRDPWGYDSYQGKKYGYFHPHLMHGYEGNIGQATWCDEDQLLEDACDCIAEPEAEKLSNG